MYLVLHRSENKAIGMCGLVNRLGLDGIDLGFAFLPGSRGKGYAYESATAMIHAAREQFGIDELLAITHPKNTASIRLITKLGFEIDCKVTLPGDETELHLFKQTL